MCVFDTRVTSRFDFTVVKQVARNCLIDFTYAQGVILTLNLQKAVNEKHRQVAAMYPSDAFSLRNSKT